MATPTVAGVVAGAAAADDADHHHDGDCVKVRGIVGGNAGNGEGKPSISLRRARLEDACSLTNVINEAYDHHKILFAKAGTNRVAPDGTEGVCL